MTYKEKARLLFGLGIAASAALTSCNDDLLAGQSEGQSTIYANYARSGAETRSAIDHTDYINGDIGLLWTPQDTIGVFGGSAANVPFTNGLSQAQRRTPFTGACSEPRYAYFPYSATAGTDVTRLRGNLPAEQSYNSTTCEIKGDYKTGTPRDGAPDEFDFRHIFSLLRLNISAEGTQLEDDELRYATIELPAGRSIAGDFTFDATTGAYSFTGNTTNKAMLRFASRPALRAGVNYEAFMSMAPDVRKGDKVVITVTAKRKQATLEAEIVQDFEPNGIYTFDLNLAGFGDRIKIEDSPIEPEFMSFSFDVANNPGKILSKKVSSTPNGTNITVSETDVLKEDLTVDAGARTVSGMIPYLYDFNLVPTFTIDGEDVKVEVNGVPQESGKTAVDFSKPVTYTLTAPSGQTSDYTVTVTNTGLPVVVLKQSSTLTGTDASWVKWFGDLSLRSKASGWAEDDQIAIYDVNGKYTLPRQAAGTRLRGNSSQDFPKKPLAVKLVKKAAIGDMPKHKRWVLLANWMDASMIRNSAAMAVAHATERAWQSGAIAQGIPWNPHGVNVELVIDGRHVGNYYLCEQIKIDANRLNIKDACEDVASPTFENCGYLIESDDAYDENFKFMTSNRHVPFMLKDNATDAIWNSVKNKIQGIETNLKKGNYSAAYDDYDINSAIDQWIIYELTMNDEFKHPKSVYTFMDGGRSKLCHGPVWDFDWMTFPNPVNINNLKSSLGTGYSPTDMNSWLYSKSKLKTYYLWDTTPKTNDLPYMFYPYLFKDPNFRKAVQQRWKVIYPYLQAVAAEIMQMGQQNARSWYVNIKMWPLNFNRRQLEFSSCFNGDEGYGDYGEVVQNLINMYNQRLEWMNNAITNGNFATKAE